MTDIERRWYGTFTADELDFFVELCIDAQVCAEFHIPTGDHWA